MYCGVVAQLVQRGIEIERLRNLGLTSVAIMHRFVLGILQSFTAWMLLTRIVLPLYRVFARLLLVICDTLIPNAHPDKTAEFR